MPHHFRSFMYIVRLACLFLLVASPVYELHAQSQNNIRVMVMGDDSGFETVSRLSNIFDRVLAELKESMLRHDFVMVDEEMLAAELGWRITENRDKKELIETAKMANGEAQANLYSRAMALFRIVATKQDLGYATRITTRVEGELYDLENNSFLGAFELPRIISGAPAECYTSSICINEYVGDKARDIAGGIGDVLGKKLAYLTQKSGEDHAGNKDPRCQSLLTAYTLEFKRMKSPDIATIIDTMTHEGNGDISDPNRFPCFVSYDMMAGGNSTLRRYAYSTTAKRAKLYDWLSLIIEDMGFSLDENILILNDGSKIIIESLIEPLPIQQNTNQSRFQ